MAIKRSLDIDPADVDPNGIAEDQTTGGAANLNLNGALCDLGTAGEFDIADSYSSGIGGVRIAGESAGNIATVVFTVTGTDQDGVAATETITGINASTVTGTVYWKTITSIAADAAVGTNVEFGTVDEIMTPVIPLDWRNGRTGATVSVTGLVGTCQFDIDETFNDLTTGAELQAATYFTNQANQTADLAAVLTVHATGVRLKFDSYTNGAELQFHVRQSDAR